MSELLSAEELKLLEIKEEKGDPLGVVIEAPEEPVSPSPLLIPSGVSAGVPAMEDASDSVDIEVEEVEEVEEIDDVDVDVDEGEGEVEEVDEVEEVEEIDDVEEVEEIEEVGASRPKRRPLPPMKEPEWVSKVFDDDFWLTVKQPPRSVVDSYVQFLKEHLEPGEGRKILDMGCGVGLHVVPLAATGAHMVAIDISSSALFQAGEYARSMNVKVDFFKQDMREMTFTEEFDGIYMIGGTFGYFDDTANEALLERVYGALKPGGRFVVEAVNRDFVAANLPSRLWWEGVGCLVMQEAIFDAAMSRVIARIEAAFPKGRQKQYEVRVRAYTLQELRNLAMAAGFRILSTSGSIFTPEAFLGPYSSSILMVLEKI